MTLHLCCLIIDILVPFGFDDPDAVATWQRACKLMEPQADASHRLFAELLSRVTRTEDGHGTFSGICRVSQEAVETSWRRNTAVSHASVKRCVRCMRDPNRRLASRSSLTFSGYQQDQARNHRHQVGRQGSRQA